MALGVPGDAMTFQSNFIGMFDYGGKDVDAFRNVNPRRASVEEMPLDLFMGKQAWQLVKCRRMISPPGELRLRQTANQMWGWNP